MTTILTETDWENRATNLLDMRKNQTVYDDQGDEISEEDLKVRSLLALLKEEFEIFKEEFERVMREINATIIDAGNHLQLQAISEEELKLQEEELKLKTLLKFLQKGTGAVITANDRALLKILTAPESKNH